MVEKAKRGDIAAFEQLYASYQRSVYSLCLRVTKDMFDAEDLTQEVFLQVYRKVNTFRGESAFGSWLYRVAVNASMMYLRKRQHVREEPLEAMNADPSSRLSCLRAKRLSDPLEHVVLARALGNLSKGSRRIIILHDIKGLTHDEIAEHLGVTTNTSKSTLSRAHHKLRDVLAGRGVLAGKQNESKFYLQTRDSRV